MSLAAQSATTVVALVAALTAVSLWRGANRHAGSVRRAYRIFALTALLWGAGAIGQQVLASASAGATFPFTGADLPGLLALPALVTGLVSLGSRREAARHPLAQRHRARIGTAVARCADGYVVASALFIIGWITVLSAGYAHSGDDPGTFAAELVHPLADLLVLGGVLPLAVAAGRRGVAPVLALLAVTASDTLAVGAKISNGHPGAASQVLLIVGFLVLGSAPWMGGSWRAGPGDAGQFTRAGAHAATALAGVTAAAAALVLIGWVLAGSPAPEPVLALVTGTTLLALTARVLILVHRDSIRSRLWHESGHQFRELADRISDVVLVCDYAGAISYASPAVRDYGYTAAGLEGQVLADLVHPEDRLGGLRAVREAASMGGTAMTDGPGEQVRYSCRVRAADGTWRYVEATISRHRSQGAPDRLLVTSRDVSDQVALRRQIAHLTYHDGLTGLPNRAYLEERAREVLSLERQGPGVAGVILVDLDAFTSVNDAAGPSAGDLVLAQVGRRLRAAVPPRGTVARWGGDVFAVLISEAASAGEIIELAQRVLASVADEPFRAADRSVALSASVGVALADGSPAGYVWRNADAAVSRAKESGGGRLEVFPAVPHPDARRHLSLAAQLGRALGPGQLAEDQSAADQPGDDQPGDDQPGEGRLGEGRPGEGRLGEGRLGEGQAGAAQLALEYRPIADLASSAVIGAEAVPRWRGEGGDVARQEFLAAAETARVTSELGDWMLRECCAQVAGWRQNGWEASLWLRCPATQMMAPSAESVLEALADSGLAPAALILEVAPEVLTEGGDVVLRGLGELRERGVRLAVDISAAGYGSLARLTHHPVDLVRIGPDLVAGLGVEAAAETLIRALVRIGQDLGIPVVADGIERAEQRDLLADLGCVLGMGMFVAGPVPPAGIQGLPGEQGAAGEHGLAGGRGPAHGELPFGDVISPASHLAS